MSIRARSGIASVSVHLGLAFGLLTFGCDEAQQVEAEAEVTLQAHATTVSATDLDLAAIVELVEREDVRDAESLEALINAEDSTLRVDVDADGQRDFIAVHEVGVARASASAEVELAAEVDGAVAVVGDHGEKIQFELRAIPSSSVTVEVDVEQSALVEIEGTTETVVVATVDLELDAKAEQVVITASYAPTVVVIADFEVEHHYVHTIALERRHDHLVIVGAPMIAWVWLDARPIYVGHVHLPPGHAKKLGLRWYAPGHHGKGHHGGGHHGKDHHDGGHHGDAGGNGKVHIKVQDKGNAGGSTKVHIKSNGGGSKVHVKSKGGGGKGKGKH